jgi:transposase
VVFGPRCQCSGENPLADRVVVHDIIGMFLRRNRRRVDGESYEYWTLVESVRTSKGPRQRVVANLGKVAGLDKDERAGWDEIARLLDGRPRTALQQDLFGDGSTEHAQWAQVDLSQVSIERVREFGPVYLALALWRRLGLHELFKQHCRHGHEQVDWATVACILSTGRFCAQDSELGISERWYATTALDDLLGVSATDVYDNRLYRGLDEVLELRERLFGHLRARYENLFGTRFEFLLYDVTSTYFEGECTRNPQAQRGYSRDNRADCKQVCIGLVVTPEGLPLAYEVFAGNRADVTTVEDMVDLMERKYGRAERIWAMDRGMVSEDNLEYLRDKDALYIVGTPRSQLRKFERELLQQADWQEVEHGVEAKLLDHPDGRGQEHYVLCRSKARHEKEAAMLRRQMQRLRIKLHQIDASLRKRPANPEKVGRRIGRWLGRNTVAENVFTVDTIVSDGLAVGLQIEEEPGKMDWCKASHGSYLLRTNCSEQDARKLWRWYIHLTQVEDAFRVGKSDLGLRPIYHHRQDRVQAHIMVCFLALVMWRTLEMWLKAKGLGDCARQVLQQMATIHSMDVVLPVRNRGQVKLRLVARPEKLVAELLAHMDLTLPTRPKTIQNVVDKNAQNRPIRYAMGNSGS